MPFRKDEISGTYRGGHKSVHTLVRKNINTFSRGIFVTKNNKE